MSEPVYINEAPGRAVVVGAPTSIALFVGRTAQGAFCQPTAIQSLSDFTGQFGKPSGDLPLTMALRDFYANGGGAAVVCRIGDPENPAAPLTEAGWLDGIAALPEEPNFNIFCLPPDVPGQDIPESVVNAAAALCADRLAMAILSPPAAWQAAWKAKTLPTALADIYPNMPLQSRRAAAVYFPDIVVADPDTAEPITVCAAGAVAGIWATIDQTRGVWAAPAGLQAGLTGVEGLAAMLTDNDGGALNTAGVCALRQFVGYGDVVWGARTLAGAQAGMDDFAYIPVRRLAFYIEASLKAGLQWTMFEPNDSALWAAITGSVDQFMTPLWRQGAFFGATASEAFFVICDASTTTPEDIEMGVVNVTVGFAPTRPAEFIVLQIQAMAAIPD